MIYLAAEHFASPPQWTWYILFYFFFAGLAGGSYVVATLLRVGGDVRDEPASRIGFLVSFPATLLCPILLTADLGASWSRFWHMLVDVTPGDTGLILHYWSPMSMGAWALLIFGFFSFVSFVDAWLMDRRRRPLLPPPVGKLFNIVGSLLGLFIASYTGVLLSVSNQPVWSDTWALSRLFLASGLSGGAVVTAGGVVVSFARMKNILEIDLENQRARVQPGGQPDESPREAPMSQNRHREVSGTIPAGRVRRPCGAETLWRRTHDGADRIQSRRDRSAAGRAP